MKSGILVLSTMIVFVVFSLPTATLAVGITRNATGGFAAIQAAVDLFRADLGGADNGIGGSFTTGRREINWDGVPDSLAEPNFLPFNFFNVNSPRGVILHSIGNIGGTHQFRVSATVASGVGARFGNLDPSYTALFPRFSAERLFHARFSNEIEILFFIPGTSIPATVRGFGAVFCDVDGIDTFIEYYGPDGSKLSGSSVSQSSNNLSFQGTSFNAGERVAKVVIRLGLSNLQFGNVDGTNGVDVVAMDDIIYGEPRAADYHTGDFDGDGVTDTNIFRPATGTWFIINSGTNTLGTVQWGQNGDIPVDGDFDGDKRADQAIFRPSDGSWWINRSSDGQALITIFGSAGDKPVAGDYDKDGKTDIAVWRPSNGNFLIARSSANFATFFGYAFGTTGDIPVEGAAQ